MDSNPPKKASISVLVACGSATFLIARDVIMLACDHIGAGTIFLMREQKLVKNNQGNQSQNFTFCNMFFFEKDVQWGLGQSPRKVGNFREF